mgnify:FL=1
MKKGEPSHPIYGTKIEVTNRLLPMRDGVRIAVDIYRPDAEGRFPALLAFAYHNKFLQSLEVSEACNNQPAWAPLWCGPAEGGDTRFFTSRGYITFARVRRWCTRSTGARSMPRTFFFLSYEKVRADLFVKRQGRAAELGIAND